MRWRLCHFARRLSLIPIQYCTCISHHRLIIVGARGLLYKAHDDVRK
eukprot:COSAG05_NODE_2239_length_3353_cov_423.015980_4_plen_47_part_00